MIESREFSEADVSYLATLETLEFDDCDFVDIDFSTIPTKASAFIDCKFTRCRMANQDFLNASLRSPVFESCNLLGINWSDLKNFDSPSFKDCKLNFSSFQRLKLKNVKFLSCSALESDFSDTDLTSCSFQETSLAGANFSRAVLTNADFRSAKDYAIDLRTAKIKGAKFSWPEAASLITVLGAEVEF